MFNLDPKYEPNRLRRNINLGAFLCKSVKVSNTSSANRPILYSLFPIEILIICGTSLTAWARGSSMSAKRTGLSGQSCLQPLFSLTDCIR